MKKAVGLLSGGLDSMLAVQLIKEQGIEVTGITFITPFFGSSRAEKAAKDLGIPLQVIDITDEHLKIVKNPRYGYGKNMNPCIDCHTLMVKKAGEFAKQNEADFLVTGEVLGERPMSQNKQSLKIVEKQSGFGGYVLRPLSAKLLDMTIPEQKGLVDREKLLDIEGKSRKPQMALAEKYGIKEYPTPAGGCLLTEEGFSKRLRKLLELVPQPDVSDLHLLRYGRHFIFDKTRFIVARTAQENEPILNLTAPNDFVFRIKNYPGPRGVLRGATDDNIIQKAALITARYSKARDRQSVSVVCNKKDQIEKEVLVETPLKTFEALSLSGFSI